MDLVSLAVRGETTQLRVIACVRHYELKVIQSSWLKAAAQGCIYTVLVLIDVDLRVKVCGDC